MDARAFQDGGFCGRRWEWANGDRPEIGGEGGIRTPDTVTRMPHFECGAFNHSATSPWPHRCKHHMGRRLCNQRETAKQERSVARRKWFIVALDRADTQKNLSRSPARRHILPEPDHDQVGD